MLMDSNEKGDESVTGCSDAANRYPCPLNTDSSLAQKLDFVCVGAKVQLALRYKSLKRFEKNVEAF